MTRCNSVSARLQGSFLMRRLAFATTLLTVFLCSCAKKEATEAPAPAATATPVSPAPAGPHVVVHLKNGKTVAGSIVASSATDMTVEGDNNIETKIPTDQVASVDYRAPRPVAVAPTPKPKAASSPTSLEPARAPLASAPPRAPRITSKTLELPVGSEISVRLNETVDSKTATEGQTYDAEITRDAKDSSGDIVIPRLSHTAVVIRSASKGNRISGASDLVLDLSTVTIDGKRYNIGTADLQKKGRDGAGLNKRTAKYAGAGAAVGAVIGAIAGGGKGAAIGAGAGAGAGVAGEVITKGGAIKIPVETILTFHLDQPLRVNVAQ